MLRALRAILDTDSALILRAGVNRGPAFAGEMGAAARRSYTVMGDVVNLAARLAARAEPGEILATGEMLERSRTRFETSPQPFLVKGKERAITAYSVGALVGIAEEEHAQEFSLVGREREVDELRAALEAARVRQGQVVELVGEPGIGKSRLVEELKTMAMGFTQLVTHCDQYATSVPYFPFRKLLRPLAGITDAESAAEAGARLKPWVEAVMPDFAPWLPLLAAPFDAEVPSTAESDEIGTSFRRERLFETVEQFLHRVLMMPTLLVVEDAHWMDDASRELLRHLVGSAQPRPWLLTITRRPEGDAFLNGGGNGHRLLELSALPSADASRLALAAAGELALSEEVPRGSRRAFRRQPAVRARARRRVTRWRRDPAGDRRDPDHDADRHARAGRPLPAAERIRSRHPVRPRPAGGRTRGRLEDVGDLDRWRRLGEFVAWEGTNTLRFRHDLFRTVAYEGLSFRRRREIHGRLGTVLEQRAGAGAVELAPQLSLHFLQAEDYEKAWRYSVAVGELAQRRSANVVAAQLFQRALAAADHLELPPAEVARIAEALGDVCELAAWYEQAEEAYARARQLSADVLAQARLMRKEGILRERQGSYPEALDWYGRGLEALDAFPRRPTG